MLFFVTVLFNLSIWADQPSVRETEIIQCKVQVPSPVGHEEMTLSVYQRGPEFRGQTSDADGDKEYPKLQPADFGIRENLAAYSETVDSQKDLNFGEKLVLFGIMVTKNTDLSTGVDHGVTRSVTVYPFFGDNQLPYYIVTSYNEQGDEIGNFFASLVTLPCL